MKLTLTHSSSFDFDKFNDKFYSKFGDYGQGVYFYKGENCCYGIVKGQYIYTVELELDSNLVVLKNCFNDNDNYLYDINKDAVLIENKPFDIVVVKQQGVKKLTIIKKTKVNDVLKDKYGGAEMFSCENGDIYEIP